MNDEANPKVLVVDDAEANIDILVEALADRYELSVAMDGETALRLAADEAPDLILLDVMMPGMDGYEVCRKLKESDDLCLVPVIFVSSLSETVDKVKGFESGGIDYVTKPFDIEEVRARAAAHISLYRLQIDTIDKRRAAEKENKTKNELRTAAHPEMRTALKTIRRYATQLGGALADHDRGLAQRLAHTVRQVSGNIGVNELQHAAEGLELAIIDDAGDDALDTLFEEVNTISAAVLEDS
jgi:putative two-component system response regulator